MGFVKIRPAKLDEADLLTELALRSKAHWGYDASFMETCRNLKQLHVKPELIEAGGVFVADHEGRLAGVYTLIPMDEATLDIDMLFVEPQFIGKGIGKALFTHICMAARATSAKRLIVESDPNAQGF